jgi:hypothetical protein
MVKYIRNLWQTLRAYQIPEFVGAWLLVMLTVYGMIVCINGCGKSTPSTTKAIPAAVQSYEVPIADTSAIPDIIYLRPGQSAIILEDTVVSARIPAQGNELYVGPVMIQKGTVVIKPRAEP